MNHSLFSYTLVFGSLVVTGCRGSLPTEKAPAPSQPPCDTCSQVDEGGYTMNNAQGTPVAWMFAFKDQVAGTMVEYWAKSASWTDGVKLDIAAVHTATCSAWRGDVCRAQGMTVYRTEVPLIGSSVEALCNAPTPGPGIDATNRFLRGAYEIKSSDITIAWVYTDDSHDLWVMREKLSARGKSGPLPFGALSPTSDFSDADGFKRYVCGLSPKPTLVFEPQYMPVSNFCATAPLDCQ